MPNRLASSTSPYLLQHKDNPVDWWPWCSEAFAEARERDVPVLLSVGYAACHWCHVMAHESFEDDATAALMNERFVCVKVDREERPDVDAVYMDAVQAMSGHGGWPMTAVLTADGEPFFAGTYFPPEARHGIPSFTQVLTAISDAWTTRRADVVELAKDVTRQLAGTATRATRPLEQAVLDSAAGSLAAAFDPVNGGFGGAPKFPPSMCLEFLLRHHARTGDATSLRVVEHTCERMARGGMYDQLAGGFARYAVDAQWVVPHFEKMLYDNALLARVYLHLWRATGSELARRIVLETCDWMTDDLLTPEGGFASALDADTNGVEGLTYAWTPAQLREVLGAEDGEWAAQLLEVTEAGTFEHGSSTLQLLADPDDPDRWTCVRQALTDARDQRPQPARDDKVVAAWNGLAVAALAETAVLLDRPHLLLHAANAAELLLRLHVVDGRLRRTSREGTVGDNAGVLEDYGDVAEGLLALYQATGAVRWLEAARELLDVAVDRFWDGTTFFDTADDAEQLVTRPQDPTDNATPSGNSAVAGALLTYAALTGSHRHREVAEAALTAAGPVAAGHARFVGWACAVGEAAQAGPVEIAVVDRPDLARVARMATSPGAVVVAQGDGPLMADRPAPAAYVCRGFVCDAPITDPDELARAVRARRE